MGLNVGTSPILPGRRPKGNRVDLIWQEQERIAGELTCSVIWACAFGTEAVAIFNE